MFIIDEVEKLPNGTLDAISAFLDINTDIDGIDFRWVCKVGTLVFTTYKMVTVLVRFSITTKVALNPSRALPAPWTQL